MQRCVNWQLAKRQRGTHKVKQKDEIWRTGKKMYAQKGTGGARHGSARVSQFRGGGRAFGPVVRSHAIDLPKKVRALALKHALSSKAKDGGIIVIDKMTLKDGKTKGSRQAVRQARPGQCADHRRRRGRSELRNAARNIPNIDVLPVQGINVYDIMRRKTLVLTKAALDALEARFK